MVYGLQPKARAAQRRGSVRPGGAALGATTAAVPCAVAGLLCAGLVSAEGSAAGPEKSGYHLFNPTLRAQLRELGTDRPDQTESPFTVDAGHFQAELDLFTFSHDRHNPEGRDVRVDEWTVGPVNLKLGIWHHFDVQLIVEPYRSVRVEDRSTGPATVTRRSGYGDTTFRAKFNLWGNDGGRTALALLPVLTVPTSEDQLGVSAAEGGLLIPFNLEWPLDFDLGLTSGGGLSQDADEAGHHPGFVNSIALGRTLGGRVSGYLE